MTTPYTPLSDAEFDELDQFLLHEVDTDEVMVLDMMDGFLHAIAIGPTTLQPKQWLSKIWGIDSMMPPVESIEKLNHILVWSCATSTASSRALRGIRAKSVLAGQR